MNKSNVISILEDYFLYVGRSGAKSDSPVTDAIIEIHNAINNNAPTRLVDVIDLSDTDELNRVIDGRKSSLCSLDARIKAMIQPISYFVSEIADNMQQHSNADKGYIFTNLDRERGQIGLVLADGGISIYGSYVNANKFIDNISNSDVLAIGIAKDGYSTKDRPDAENRGYGLSSNIKMITQGLRGDLVIMSGNALYISSIDKLIELPEQLDWKGTLVLATIPVDKPETFNFYDYI